MPDSLRILYVDAFSTLAAWANTQGLAAAYRRAGELYTYDYRAKTHETKAPWSRPEIWECPEWKELVACGLQSMRDDLVKVAAWYKPDLVHLGKCEYLDGETVKRIKAKTDAFVVHYYGDFSRKPKPWVVDIGGIADWTLLCHQDLDIVTMHKEAGCQRVGFWWTGTDPSVYYPRKVEKRDFDIVFMGRPIREGGCERAELLSTLAQIDLNVHVFGGNWTKMRGLKQVHFHRFTDGDGLAWACSRAKIALSLNANVRMYASWRRIFNTMASGAFLLIRYFPGLETVFTRCEHLQWFTTRSEAVEKVRYYLENEDQRNEIAQRGSEIVRQKHTWDVRVSEILSLREAGQ